MIAAAIGMRPPYDVGGYVVGEDFVNTWMSGRAALTGNPGPWLDPHVYNAAVRHVFGAGFPEQNWSYPPHILLFTWVLGLLPYVPACAAWNVAGLALYFVVVMKGERRFDRLLFFSLAPAVVSNVLVGQNGFVTAALMIGGLKHTGKRPILAGVLFGLLTLKPQIGLLVPAMLCVTRQWRCIFAAATTTLVLVVSTSVIFGNDVWDAYIHFALPAQNHILQEDKSQFIAYMPTAFMNMRLIGLPLGLAWIVQALVSAAALAAVIWTFRQRRDPALSSALFITASLVATPYMFPYDTVMLIWAITRLRERAGVNVWDDAVALAAWTLPAAAFGLGLAGIPVSALVPLALLARIVFRLQQEENHQK
ncbi:MAG: DUF2029 domain-containing protein [Alphaproteobacteria bacterium]|nr:DUF2029 domain-containing protein [Alphaproteobacteria bacterium]